MTKIILNWLLQCKNGMNILVLRSMENMLCHWGMVSCSLCTMQPSRFGARRGPLPSFQNSTLGVQLLQLSLATAADIEEKEEEEEERMFLRLHFLSVCPAVWPSIHTSILLLTVPSISTSGCTIKQTVLSRPYAGKRRKGL